MAGDAEEGGALAMEVNGSCGWTWAVKLSDGVRVGSAQRALPLLGLILLLFGALYCNQAYRDLSFQWLSRAIASTASSSPVSARSVADMAPVPAPAPALASSCGSLKHYEPLVHSSEAGFGDTGAEIAPPVAAMETLVELAPTVDSSSSAPQAVLAPLIELPPTADFSASKLQSGSPILDQGNSLNGALSPAPSLKPSQHLNSDLRPSPADQGFKWRSSLDLDLKNAKKAIAMASQVPDDVELHPPLYNNVSAFKMSYKIMEHVFKVYVYEEGEKPLVRDGPLTGIYSSEGHFIKRMVDGNQFTVKDYTQAHIFFLPYSVANMVEKLYVPDSYTMQPINEYIRDYVNMLAAKYPFWNETHGADHFIVSCHDWGLMTTLDHKELNKNTVKVLCNADSSEGFVPARDASLPEMYLHSVKLPQKLGGPGPKGRPILAFFAGQMHGRVRPILLDHWKDKDPDMKIYEVLPLSVAKKMSYVQHMKSSKYCICAMGYEVNSPRIVEAIYYDCVPVIIADNFVLPFSDVLKWDAFSLTVAEIDIPNLKKILLGVPDKRYQEMQKRLKIVRQHFIWHDGVVRYDVFHMILHSVWVKRLGQVSP